mmetsp:Transcript_14044/g.28929  ORF Transcript_14044/g.28929 Transcript_14044/m.28929 type:complete len:102 (+) Transcript_14044:313-618(+)
MAYHITGRHGSVCDSVEENGPSDPMQSHSSLHSVILLRLLRVPYSYSYHKRECVFHLERKRRVSESSRVESHRIESNRVELQCVTSEQQLANNNKNNKSTY